ncbi:MAG TPA: SigB/SigF/SigG family RNA polymerase sigma factor [Solirubrobacteraceae bacterium]|nr:SigB/SigF/SigG family RNA polymerase sigma factor [Solirubrobacteraceae bacterium]
MPKLQSPPSRATVRVGQADPSELFLRWQRGGDEAAHEALVRHYMPLARSLARRYRNTSEPFEDLFQVAQLGLLRALQRYDAERGFPFQAFAVPTILGELRRYFRNCSWAVHVPRGAQERALKLRDAQHQLAERSGRAPTVNELAEYLELSTEEVLDGLQALQGYGAMSLDAPRGDEAGGDRDTYVDALGEDDASYELVELGLSVATAVKQLSPQEREILHMRFAEELSQTQIAARIGVSQMQVSRLLKRCLEELRELAGDQSGKLRERV